MVQSFSRSGWLLSYDGLKFEFHYFFFDFLRDFYVTSSTNENFASYDFFQIFRQLFFQRIRRLSQMSCATFADVIKIFQFRQNLENFYANISTKNTYVKFVLEPTIIFWKLSTQFSGTISTRKKLKISTIKIHRKNYENNFQSDFIRSKVYSGQITPPGFKYHIKIRKFLSLHQE